MADLPKVQRDFNEAIHQAENALPGTLAVIEAMVANITQLLEKIREQRKRMTQVLQSGLIGLPAEQENLKNLQTVAQALDATEQELYQKNRELNKSLANLRELQGKLPADSQQQVARQAEQLQHSIEAAEAYNQSLSASIKLDIQKTVASGFPLQPVSKEKAEEVKTILESKLNTISGNMKELKEALRSAPMEEVRVEKKEQEQEQSKKMRP